MSPPESERLLRAFRDEAMPCIRRLGLLSVIKESALHMPSGAYHQVVSAIERSRGDVRLVSGTLERLAGQPQMQVVMRAVLLSFMAHVLVRYAGWKWVRTNKDGVVEFLDKAGKNVFFYSDTLGFGVRGDANTVKHETLKDFLESPQVRCRNHPLTIWN